MLCWGSTKYGQLGLGGIEEETIPTPTKNKHLSLNIKQVSCGVNHTLFLVDDGSVYSCGNNDFEQLGHGGPRKKPEKVEGLEADSIVQIAAGHSFSLALNKHGQLFCWGAVSGQTDDDLFFIKPVQIRFGQDYQQIVQIVCGYYFFMYLTNDGKIYVMGNNNYGQLGLGSTKIAMSQPVYLQSLQGIPVMQIACGAYHSMVLTVSGNIFSFGRNDFGQLGFGDTEDRSYPMNLKALNQLKASYIACGENFTAVLTQDGGVFTFGAGMYGQLGHGQLGHEYLPRKIPDLMGSQVTQIACGRCHTLVYLASNKRLYCFGLGGNGQLGVGSVINKTSPSFVTVELENVKNTSEVSNDLKLPDKNLYVVSAGGDQSFITCSQTTDNIEPLDFRFIANRNEILTINVVEQMNKNSLMKSLNNKSNPSINTKLNNLNAIDNSLQLKDFQTVLSSSSCLNASFLNKCDHYSTSNKYPGVDMSKVKDVHQLLTSLNDQLLNELVVTQLTKLYSDLPESPPSIEALRIYITTPFLTEFAEKMKTTEQTFHMMLFAYAQSINRLKKEAAGRVLDYWFAWAGVEFFKSLIKAYKNIVIHIINLKVVTVESEVIYRHNLLKTSMLFLQKLHKINLEFREIVNFDTFYINELVEKVDIKQDYFEWLRRKNLKNDSVLFCDYPFVFDARAKTQLLQTDAEIQMQVALQEAWHQNINSIFLPTIDPVNPLLTLFIRREHVVQDTLNQLSKQKRDDLKKPLKVMFIGEDGYDAGGVKKEFFMLLLREILDLKYGMFIFYEETNTIWFNDQTLEGSDMYDLIGKLCGLAIYNSTIINLPFPLVLYKKLLKETPTIQDLRQLSPSVAKSLESLLKYDGDDFESTFCLNFEITRQRFDQTINVELMPGGSKIPVTKENRKQYVNAYVDFLLNKSVEHAFDAFNSGFHHVCGSKVLELFHSSELMAMIIGNENYDFTEFESTAEYKGDFAAEHPVIKNFWSVFHELTTEQKKKFLVFLTGTDRIPILGMKRVKIFIQSTNGGDSFFPVAHTCFNLLDLPQYSKKEILKERLLIAIEHNQGFTIV